MRGVAGRFAVDIEINGKTYPIDNGQLLSLRIHETSLLLSPMAELLIEDRLNFLVELIPFTGTETVRLRLGVDETSLFDHKFIIYKGSTQRSSNDSHTVKLYLVSKQCLGLFYPARFKSYTDSTISSIASAIASDLGLVTNSQGFENSVGSYDLFCPGWNYAQFLIWLASQTRSVSYNTAGFMVFVDLEGKLHFCSPEFVMASNSVATIVSKDLRNPDKYNESDLNQGPYNTFTNQLLLGTQGAYGMNLTYFDFMGTGARFVEEPMTVNGESGVQTVHPTSGFTSPGHSRSAVAGTQLKGTASNVSLLRSMLNQDTVVVDGGSISDVQNLKMTQASQEARMLRAVNSLVSIKALIDGNMSIRAGTSVKFEINSPHPKAMRNQTFSGKYIVERVTHQIVPSYATQLFCFRSGIGGANNNDLLTPPGGLLTGDK